MDGSIQKKPNRFVEFLRTIGPGMFLAATAIGPGSIVSASTTGSRFGYALAWWMVITVLFRGLFQYASSYYGIAAGESIIEGIRRNYGKGWSIVASVFAWVTFVSYSIGNATGVGLGLNILFPGLSVKVWMVIGVAVALAAFFLKNVIGAVENVMKICILLMIGGFLVTYIMGGVKDPGEVARGFLPSIPGGSATLMLSLLGTSSSLAACAYSSSLVKMKGWTMEDVKKKRILLDVVFSMIAICLITLLVMFVSAEVLRDNPIKNGRDLAEGLSSVIGGVARPLVGLGIFSAAFSSVIGAPKIAMTLVVQGFGVEDEKKTRNINTIGCIAITLFAVAVGLILGSAPAQLLILAQIGAIISTPLLGIFIILLIRNKSLGEKRLKTSYVICISLAYIFIMATIINNLINLIR